MKDQRLVVAFAEVAFNDVQRLKRRLAKREDELAAWVSELTPENQRVFAQWRAEQEQRSHPAGD